MLVLASLVDGYVSGCLPTHYDTQNKHTFKLPHGMPCMVRLVKPPRRLLYCRPTIARQFATISHRRKDSNGRSLPTSQQHHDIESFLSYADNAGLSAERSVYVGTLFEYTVLRTLSRLRMTLSRVGGRDDRGVDLRGTWLPPSSPHLPPRLELQVYVQCKAERTRTGPKYLRELEGTLGISATPQHPPIGILAATRPCTPGLRRHMFLSRMPLAYCRITPYKQGGYLQQFLWNAEVGKLIGRGVGVTTRYVCRDNDEDVHQEAVLTVDGQVAAMEDERKCHSLSNVRTRGFVSESRN